MKKFIATVLSLVIFISAIPFSNVVFAENAGELSLEQFDDGELYDLVARQNGEMTLSEIKASKLSDDDIPEFVDASVLSANDSVKRLKDNESSLNSVTYLNKDGSKSDIIYSENVKYIENGIVKDKSNKVTFDSLSNAYINPDNDIRTTFPKKLASSSAVAVAYNGYDIKIVPNGVKALNAQLEDDRVIYDKAFGDGTYLSYKPTYSGLKEDIVLTEYTDVNVFSFEIQALGLTLECIDGDYVLTDKGEVKAYFGELVIFDSNGNVGTGSVDAVQNENGVINYSITVDKQFLRNAAYPVTVDPAVAFTTASDIVDAYVKAGSTTLNTTASRIIIGSTSSTDPIKRMIVKLPTAANVVINRYGINNVTSVKYYMYCYNTPSASTHIGAYRMTESWGSTATTVSSTLFSAYTTTGGAIASISSSTANSYIGMELKSIFSSWASGSANNGVMIKFTSEQESRSVYTNTMEYTVESKRPYVVVKYNGTLPTTPNANVSSKSLYRISTPTQTAKYITKRVTSSSTSLTLENASTATGSTSALSQYVAVNYVEGGKYTLSFLNGEGSNLYLRANSDDSVSFVSSDTALNAQWYIIYNSIGTSYTFINAYYSTSYLTYNTDNSIINRPSNISAGDTWYMTKVGLDVPLIMQRTDYWCSAATTHQILSYFEVDDDVPGTTVEAKQEYLQNQVDGVVWNIFFTLNNYLDFQVEYSYYNISTVTNLQMMNEYIQNSISGGFPVVLHTWTDVYNYYEGDNYGHYICLVGYDPVTCNYILRDCNSLKPSLDWPYFGEFVVPPIQVYNGTINSVATHQGVVPADENNNRYIICKKFPLVNGEEL